MRNLKNMVGHGAQAPRSLTHHGTQHAGHIDGIPPGGAVLVSVRHKLWVGVQDHQTDVQDIRVKLQMHESRVKVKEARASGVRLRWVPVRSSRGCL